MTQFDPEYDDQIDDDEDIDEGGSLPAKLRKQLKEANKRAKEAEARAEANIAAARRVAFLDANIPDTPQTRYFRDRYDGDLNAEAIRAEALANGFIEADDTSKEIEEIESSTENFSGGAQPTSLGSMDEFRAEVEKAVAKAKPGQENRAIDEVRQRFAKTVV